MLQNLISYVKNRLEDPLAAIGIAAIVATVVTVILISNDLIKKNGKGGK